MKFGVLVLLGVFWAVSALGGNYKLDASHTRLGFKVRHLGIASVRGQFNKLVFEGNLINLKAKEPMMKSQAR